MSSAFCNTQCIANIVSSLIVLSLSFISHQFIKFSIRCQILFKFGPELLSILLLVGLGFRIESVVMYVDVVRPSVTSSSCLNSGHCLCGTCHYWCFIPPMAYHLSYEAWCCKIKPGCFNFSPLPLRVSIKVPTVLLTLMSTIVSPTTSIRLSMDITHV
jgi:hypothetical protein